MTRRGYRQSSRRRSKWRSAAGVAALFIVLVGLAEGFDRLRRHSLEGEFRAVDGDTLALGDERYRIAGIDAPERGQVCVGDVGRYDCGRASLEHLRLLLARPGVTRCTGADRDRYRRLLVICTKAGDDLGRRMVLEGWAVSFGDYVADEAAARLSASGLWAGEFDRPADWRRALDRPGEQEYSAASVTVRVLRSLGDYLSGR